MSEIRTATFAELDTRTAYLLWKLRGDVFVVEQECPYPELDGRDMESATVHMWIEEHDVPVAYLRILEDGDMARIGRVVCNAGYRGKGYPTKLMNAAVERIGSQVSRLDAQSYLTHWYERFGYRASGSEFLEDGIPHTPMLRQPTE